jgi:pyruvate-formate lyase-activating enzyme
MDIIQQLIHQDTSASESYKSILQYTDLFLFDIKHLDEAKHIESTGVSNTGILDNYKLLLESGKDVMVRIPVIPGLMMIMIIWKLLKDPL